MSKEQKDKGVIMSKKYDYLEIGRASCRERV